MVERAQSGMGDKAQYDAACPDVALEAVHAIANLGCEILHGANGRQAGINLQDSVWAEDRESEIGALDFEVMRNEEVIGLNVAVDDPELVAVVCGHDALAQQGRCVVLGVRPRPATVINQVPEDKN